MKRAISLGRVESFPRHRGGAHGVQLFRGTLSRVSARPGARRGCIFPRQPDKPHATSSFINKYELSRVSEYRICRRTKKKGDRMAGKQSKEGTGGNIPTFFRVQPGRVRQPPRKNPSYHLTVPPSAAPFPRYNVSVSRWGQSLSGSGASTDRSDSECTQIRLIVECAKRDSAR